MSLFPRFNNDGQPEVYLNDIQLREKDTLLQKLKQGEYSETSRQCSICQSTDTEIVAEKDMFGLPTRTVLCKSCGFLFTDPVMQEKNYEDFYTYHYRKLYEGVDKPGMSIAGEQEGRGQEVFKFVKNQIDLPQGARIAELGCGAGGILKPFHQAGYKVTGFDFDPKYLEFGRKQGLDLREMKELKNFGEKVDLVVSSHVIEHVWDLNKSLEQILGLLKPGGHVYVEVPGLYNMKNTCGGNLLLFLQNAHLYHFTLSSLENLMASRGLRLLDGTEYVRAVFVYEQEKPLSVKKHYDEVKSFIVESEQKYDVAGNRLRNQIRKGAFWFLRKTGLFSLVRSVYYKLRGAK